MHGERLRRRVLDSGSCLYPSIRRYPENVAHVLMPNGVRSPLFQQFLVQHLGSHSAAPALVLPPSVPTQKTHVWILLTAVRLDHTHTQAVE